MTVPAIPDGYHSLTPYLICKGAADAIDFYQRAFDAEEVMRLDMPGGMIGHAELKIGNSHLMLADACEMASAPPVQACSPRAQRYQCLQAKHRCPRRQSS